MECFQYTEAFDRRFGYDGSDLGAACDGRSTCFKLWAPFADRIELRLYREGNGTGAPCRILEPARRERGVWELWIEEDLHGIYYEYLVWTAGEVARTADPCAVGCGCNGYRSMVVDLRRTDPEGFRQDRSPALQAENIIYELHIKDFSYDPHSGVPEEYRGKYKAFTVQATGKAEEGTFETGVAYLQKLGITHVHLLPFFDYGWLDEAGGQEQFNWGYDPVNYNVPEGSYATDVHDGTVRIRECKEMIQALHRAGIRVVMDVVYNHTLRADSWLERTAPGYFCRRFPDGNLSNGSACGSDIAVGRQMVDNYIVNSVLYWAREYHVDGFRFDLMGLLTVELMNRIRRELDREFGVGEKLLYGEPWRAGESPMEKRTRAALKENVAYLDEGIAMFSDDTRDAIKGHVFHEEKPGFVNGGKGLEEKVLRAVTGWCGPGMETLGNRPMTQSGVNRKPAASGEDASDFHPRSCAQVVNYVSAHDNFTLWDKLVMTLHGNGADYTKVYADVLRANKLAALLYFTCQGHLFLQAGEEFGRTKLGDGNSYRSCPKVNMLKWQQTREFSELVEYYRGLIRLRKGQPGLCDKSGEAWKRVLDRQILAEGVVAYWMDNRPADRKGPARETLDEEGGSSRKQQDGGGSTQEIWQELYVVYNASGQPVQAGLPRWGRPGCWVILADGALADCRKEVAPEGNGQVTVGACTGMVLGYRC